MKRTDNLTKPGPSSQQVNSTVLTRDLNSDSDTSISDVIMASHLEKMLTGKQLRSIEMNTESRRVHTEDKVHRLNL